MHIESDAELWVAANSFARKGDGFSSAETGQNYSQPKVEKGEQGKQCALLTRQVFFFIFCTVFATNLVIFCIILRAIL
jgi:hypothetical protein